MKERPILMSGPMVRAILDGRKTVTRRIVNPEPLASVTDWLNDAGMWTPLEDGGMCNGALVSAADPVRCPFGVPGDRLWCRERARVLDYSTGPVADGVTGTLARLRYEADGAEAWVPFPSRLWTVTEGHCVPNGVFREGARLWLDVVSVRVERLHDISEEDARAEGCHDFYHDGYAFDYRATRPALANFRRLWESIAGPGSWYLNPWLWCVGFRRLP